MAIVHSYLSARSSYTYAIRYRRSTLPLGLGWTDNRLNLLCLVDCAKWWWFPPKTGGKYVAFTPWRKMKCKQ
jgi:hypothetical protein